MKQSLNHIVSLVQGQLENQEALDPSVLNQCCVAKISSLEKADFDSVTFFFSKSFEPYLSHLNAAILVTQTRFVPEIKKSQTRLWSCTAIVSFKDPYLGMALVSELFSGQSPGSHLPEVSGEVGVEKQAWIHPTATVDSTAVLGPGVWVGANVVIEAHARVGKNTRFYPGAYLGEGSQVGDNCVLFPNVVIYPKVTLGNRVRLHAGSVIGADGFGYAQRYQDGVIKGHHKIYHMGTVILEDDVEIGANSAVDRGTFGATRIGKNSKIDNLVQIAHNVELDEGVIICGHAGLAGNVHVGQYAQILGMAGVTNQVHIGERSRVAAYTCVSKDVAPGTQVAGNPQRPFQEHFKVHALLNQWLAKRRERWKSSP